MGCCAAAAVRRSPAGAGPAASSAIDPATNLEVAPLLTILSSDQKDLLILRALQRQPALADLLLGMAAEPISPEEAAARVEAPSDGAAAAVACTRSHIASSDAPRASERRSTSWRPMGSSYAREREEKKRNITVLLALDRHGVCLSQEGEGCEKGRGGRR